MNYRSDARRHLQAAKSELDSNDDARLKYAALELRMTMEALTYDRALAFKDEFPPDEYETWQPRKVMSILLEIDSTADNDSSLAFEVEKQSGVPPTNMQPHGSEKVLNMAALRKHYDALGSYLHVPSMKQTGSGKVVDFGKVRSRCEEIATLVEDVLSSRVFNVTLGSFAKLDCMLCNKPVRKRIPEGQSEFSAECYACQATYTLVTLENGDIEWRANLQEVRCANVGCDTAIVLWQHEIILGSHWKCAGCGGRNVFALGVYYDNDVSHAGNRPSELE